ncbi:MAG TPA: sterol desaturase family protein [Polyangia bacterium]
MAERLGRLSLARRDELRARLVAGIPRWYNPWLHLVVPSLVGLGVLVACTLLLRGVKPLELLTVPATFLVINAGEWRIHRDILHKRTPPLTVLYDRHTPEHHMVFVTDDMAIRSWREFYLVLIPAYGIVAAAFGALPFPAALWLGFGLRNPALLFMATTMVYVVLYEWLHLSYHLPSDSFIGRLRLIQVLRRHHAVHHAPELMQKWNFNVTIPLWDWVRRTIYRDAVPSSSTVTATGSAPSASRSR